ncbi:MULTISPECIES: hypothetical protein [Meridianimaribacter]|uniref:Uncharacterized protein n=1 Tax=Meridianimaribacter flavus TaxID=571115 RepID=A0ABY2G2M9_9FLAO|nr:MULTISPECIES: hypothetical protein [Meridianimaribacter]TBV25121.1 hypothetical protein DMZ43_12470 [Meridianimaribacter sp. CL38]TDY10539.1 hypothetical protein A8975_2265 [Meridianimaribacter flavus]
MNNYIKIKNRDGLIYFNKFDKTELVYYKKPNNKIVININVSADSFDRSENEKASLEKYLNTELHTDANQCWIKLRLFHTEFKDIEDINNSTIKIKRGYEINSKNDSAAHYGIWSPRELYNNEIKFQKEDNQLKLIWTATSDDINYYTSNANDNNMELACNLKLLGFNSEKEYWNYEMEQLGLK